MDSTVVTVPMKMYMGDATPIEVQIYPNDSLVSRIDYKSSNSGIVSILPDGTVVGNGYGQAEIFATPHVFIDGLETKTGSCIVNVYAHVEGVTMPSTMSVHIGEKKTVNAQTIPLGITDNQLSFVSSNPSIAMAANDGFVVGCKRGTCTITATSVDGGYTATCEVTVTQPVEALTLEKHSISLKVGESEKVFAQINPATADNKTIVWVSSNEEIASVNADGTINALKGGEAWIKAVSQDNVEAKDSCKVTVTQPVTGIALSETSVLMNNVGESVQLNAVLEPADATNKAVRWSSTNTAVCTVANGYVVATGYGTAVVLVSTVDGGFMAACTVTVDPATEIADVQPEGDTTIEYYNINGVKIENPNAPGIYIVRQADGRMKKIIKK